MKNKFALSGISGLMFILWIVIIKNVDVAAIGPDGTSVGLSGINEAVHDLFGVNMLWYKITVCLGIFAFACVGAVAFIGLLQLMKRKSIAKVDKCIIAAGGLYVVTACIYVLFEKIIINYRPVIMPDADEPEASFPSTHTMIICVVMGSIVVLAGQYIKDKNLKRLTVIISIAIAVVTVGGRLISGVHWFSDIIGGILVSLFLVFMYAGIVEKANKQS